MKKLILSLCCLFIFSQTGLIAQSASDFYKKAKKSFDKYQQSEETKNLDDALHSIQNAISKIAKKDAKKEVKIWMKAGEIYNEIAFSDYKIFLVNNNHLPKYPEASLKAYEAFSNAVNKSDKKWDKSDACDELLKTATFISNEGIVAYNIESYEKAFTSFEKIIDIRNFLNKQNHISILSKPNEYNQHLFRTALAAQRSNHEVEALSYFEQLAEANYNNPIVYTSLAAIHQKSDKETKALSAIKNGRAIFPEDEALMLAEINHYLEKGSLNELTNKLENAIKINPKNPALYSSLGHVYNQMQKQEVQKNNFNLSKTYFQKSRSYFTQALEVNDTYGPALYNLGALYYNNAATITKEIKVLEGDQTSEGLRSVMAKKSEMLSALDQALPYFQRAEAVNPSDQATLSALKEIYSRKNDSTLVAEFENRLKRIQTGEKIESYFDN